jgi:hypothetical protein
VVILPNSLGFCKLQAAIFDLFGWGGRFFLQIILRQAAQRLAH